MSIDKQARGSGHAVAVIGVGVVALTAAVISLAHVRSLALVAGETTLATWLLPLSIDGAIAAAAAVVLADSRSGRSSSWLTWLMLVLGLSASLAANIASAQPDWTARLIAAWPPIALALGVEVLAKTVRTTPDQTVAKTVRTTPDQTVAKTVRTTPDQTVLDRVRAAIADGSLPPQPSGTAIQTTLGIGKSKALAAAKNLADVQENTTVAPSVKELHTVTKNGVIESQSQSLARARVGGVSGETETVRHSAEPSLSVVGGKS